MQEIIDTIVALNNDVGGALAFALAFIGFNELIVIPIIFGKQLKEKEEKLIKTTDIVARTEIEKSISSLKQVTKIIKGSGIIFLMAGAYLLYKM